MHLEPQWPSILEGQPPSKQGLNSKQNGHLGSKPPRSRADGRIAWRDCCGTSSLSSWGSSDHGVFLFLMQTTWKVEKHPKCYCKYVVIMFLIWIWSKSSKEKGKRKLSIPKLWSSFDTGFGPAWHATTYCFGTEVGHFVGEGFMF